MFLIVILIKGVGIFNKMVHEHIKVKDGEGSEMSWIKPYSAR